MPENYSTRIPPRPRRPPGGGPCQAGRGLLDSKDAGRDAPTGFFLIGDRNLAWAIRGLGEHRRGLGHGFQYLAPAGGGGGGTEGGRLSPPGQGAGRSAPGAGSRGRRAAGPRDPGGGPAGVAEFVALARRKGAERVVLAATQACRRAADGAAFVAELGREFALDSARVLSGREEAGLARRGVLSRLTGPTQGALLADVGGGSTELSPLGEEGRMLSLPLGAVGLSEAHLTGDPPPRRVEHWGSVAGDSRSRRGGGLPRLWPRGDHAPPGGLPQPGTTEYQPERIDKHTLAPANDGSLGAAGRAAPRHADKYPPGAERADIIWPLAILLAVAGAGLFLTAMKRVFWRNLARAAATRPRRGITWPIMISPGTYSKDSCSGTASAR